MSDVSVLDVLLDAEPIGTLSLIQGERVQQNGSYALLGGGPRRFGGWFAQGKEQAG